MNRIKTLRLHHGYTQDQLAHLLGIQKAAVCKYETGRTCPSQKVLLRLSELFEVSIDYLLGCSDQPNAGETVAGVSLCPIPILGRVHAGAPIFAEENVIDYIPVPQQAVNDGEYFFMEVVGDCMTDAHIVEGSLVLVRLQPNVKNSEIAVIRIDDEVVLRKVKFLENQLILYPANPKYEPMIIQHGQVQIIGKVMEVRIGF